MLIFPLNRLKHKLGICDVRKAVNTTLIIVQSLFHAITYCYLHFFSKFAMVQNNPKIY